jgi:phosphinothricin acetyltransferase
MSLRLARPDDAESFAVIYRPAVTDGATSFEATPPDAEAMARRVQHCLDQGFPWLVATDGDRVLGYAYAGLHRERAAYAWSAETSVYLAADAQGKGLGTQLMTALLELLTLQGYAQVFAGLTLPNAASLRLHEKLGFQPCGRYRRVGFKHGQWHDTWWGQRALTQPRAPAPPRRLDELGDVDSYWTRWSSEG